MSIVSIFIMITVENIILHLVFPQSATHEMRNMQNMMYSYSVVMMIAMALGFLFALPYNYYQIEKNGKECHS